MLASDVPTRNMNMCNIYMLVQVKNPFKGRLGRHIPLPQHDFECLEGNSPPGLLAGCSSRFTVLGKKDWL